MDSLVVSNRFFVVVLFERKVASGAISEDSGHPAVRSTSHCAKHSFSMFCCRKAAYHLSCLTSVVVQLEPAWSRAFLRRCRFLDSEFQGELLAVISKY